MPVSTIPDHLLSPETIAARLELMEDTYADQLSKPESEKNHVWLKHAKARIAELDQILKQKQS